MSDVDWFPDLIVVSGEMCGYFIGRPARVRFESSMPHALVP